MVIFIRFDDENNYTAPYGFDHYDELLNGVGMVSLRDYYLEVSYNQLTIDSIFTHNQIVFYEAIKPRGYYQPYDQTTNPDGYINEDIAHDREHSLLNDAVDWVENEGFISDTINLDVNNDGYIDSITFMVSGEDSGWNSLLWPHKFELWNISHDLPTINGKSAWTYTFELLGDSTDYNYQVDVAVLAHETFHLISAPDLYHYYDYDWIDAIGEWGLMATIGPVPSHMLGYMKYQYGNWIDDATDLTVSGSYTLYPLQDDGNNMYKISLGYSNEFIYIEYRDDEGLYESTLPSTGLVVYRVDKDFVDDGNVNGYYDNDQAAEEVWVYRPDMYDTEYPISLDDASYLNPDGDPYNAGISDLNTYDEIGVETDILLFDSAGDEIEIKIHNVVEYDGYITFDVTFYSDNTPKIKLNGTDNMVLEYEEYYRDPGYNVTVDGYDDNVTVEGSVDIYTLGDYIITYTLKDDEGNILEVKTRTVSIVDLTDPTANILVGVDTISIGEVWIDSGVLMSDNYDTDLTVEVTSDLDNTTEGTYEIEYKVLDSEGNYVKVTRFVNVVASEYSFSDFICIKGQTTFTTSETLIAPRCNYGTTELEPTNMADINSLQPGTYEILFETDINGETHIFRTYIFIIYNYENIVAIIPEERRRDL